MLLQARAKDGGLVADGRTWTGFADSEEEEINQMFGKAKKNPNTRFVREAANTPFAVRDGNLITGQQQYSSELTTEMVIEALEERRSSLPPEVETLSFSFTSDVAEHHVTAHRCRPVATR